MEFYFKSPWIKKMLRASSWTLFFFQLLDHFYLFCEDRRGKWGLHDVSVSDVAGLPITGACFLSQGSRHLLPRRTSLVQGCWPGNEQGALQRDAEITFVSFLSNFISVDVSLFPCAYSFPSPPLPHFFFQLCSQPKKMNRKNNYDSEEKNRFKTAICETLGSLWLIFIFII